MGETPIHQVAAQFAFQVPETPALQVLHDTAAQQAIGCEAGPSGAGGGGIASGLTLPDQLEQLRIVQQRIDGIEQIVLEEGGLHGQRGIEDPGLVGSRRDHRTRLYRVRYIMSNRKCHRGVIFWGENLGKARTTYRSATLSISRAASIAAFSRRFCNSL